MYDTQVHEVIIYNEIWRPGYVNYERTDSGTIDVYNQSTGEVVAEIDMTTDDVDNKGMAKIKLPIGTYKFSYDTLEENNRVVEDDIVVGVSLDKVKNREKIEVTLKQEPISAKLNVKVKGIDMETGGVSVDTLRKCEFLIRTSTRVWVDGLHLNEDGTLVVPDLPPGEYEIQAVSETPGLTWKQRNIPFKVNSGSENINVTYEVTGEGAVLELTVTDSNGKPDYGTFIVDGKTVQVKGGTALINIPKSKDVIITQSPVGDKVGLTKPVIIKGDENSNELRKLSVKNNIPTYKLTIETLDSKTKEILMGAEYIITSSEGMEYKYVVGDSEVRLPLGEYKIKQTSSPLKGDTRYILQKTETPIKIDKDEKVTIYNSMEEPEEKTALKKGLPWGVLLVTLVIGAGIFIIFRR